MKKALKIIFITLLCIYFLFKLLNLSGVLKVYTINGISSEPNIIANSRVFSSSLPTPKNGDFIMLELNDTLTVTHRLCAQEHDIVAIRDGVLFVNDTKADDGIDLMHQYKFPTKEFVENLEGNPFIKMPIELHDSVFFFINDKKAEELRLLPYRNIAKKGVADQSIKSIYHSDWNKDNFGPIKIPAGKVFVLGDNRDNAMDSRYLGLIDKSKIIGTIIYKK
ncbi:MAG: signal peptidase I [Flavobacterium sp.]